MLEDTLFKVYNIETMISRTMYPLVLGLFLIYFSHGVCAVEMTLEDLQYVYKNSTPGQMVCYYDGSRCTRGQEYCSITDKTCKSLFEKDASEENKLTTCTEIIRKNVREPGVYDTCIYFLGDLESQRVIQNIMERHPHGSHPLQTTGKELCPFPDKYCQLGFEFCNFTSGNCEPLFPSGVNDTEKRQICGQVIKRNITMLLDACKYALGILGCPSFNETNLKPVEGANHKNEWAIPVTVSLAILVVILICIIVAGIVFIIRRKKLLCSKQTPTPGEEPKPEGRQDSGDIPMAGEANRQALLDNINGNDDTTLD